MQALLVRSCGLKLGALLDNCSTDNYIMHNIAKKLKLSGEDVELEVESYAKLCAKFYLNPEQMKRP